MPDVHCMRQGRSGPVEAMTSREAVVAEHDFGQELGFAAHAMYLYCRGVATAPRFKRAGVNAEIADVTLLQACHDRSFAVLLS
ncbi:hypothetical protein [Methylibium sp.]|uniref:hypothetical protein n=1 Tax=Methylibium sp. TaxID=2067992 RepID=UPI00286A49D0|nr:hypothetical protein [Methylibium sp.]